MDQDKTKGNQENSSKKSYNTYNKKKNNNYKSKYKSSNYSKDKSSNSGGYKKDGYKTREGSNKPQGQKKTNHPKSKKVYRGNKYNPRKSRYTRNPAYETAEDIKKDLVRIEKEIRLEIEEIKSMKL